jgi:preprotein translocase subunit Sec61beta
MAEGGISLPSGMGGLMRYFDEYKSKIQLKPVHIVFLIVLFIVLEVLIRI